MLQAPVPIQILPNLFPQKLSKPQPNHNTTQLNLTRVGFDTIITLHHPPPPTPQELYFYQK